MKGVWNILPEPPKAFFDTHKDISPIALTLLFHRGITQKEEIETFLHPNYQRDVHDPYLFSQMEKTVKRIFQAMEKNEHIVVHGDYDADGVSGSVILTDFFKAMQYEHFDVYLPHRETDGYGLQVSTVESLHVEKTKLIITCDCGISNIDGVRRANELGIDVIITDHHDVPKNPPDAFSIIHPLLPGETYPDSTLAGGAVAFKLLQALLLYHKKENDLLPNGEPHEALEKWSLDMVALSSVADMVPMLYETRTLTKYGLIVLNRAKRLGMKKLLMECRLMEHDESMKKEITAKTIGFQIAPRINAAGRINHANVGYKLLVAEKGTDAVDFAFELEQNNKERQKLTAEAVKQAKQQVTDDSTPVIFVMNPDWPSGLVGLIASRLKDAFSKPVIAMTYRNNQIVGSGRSITGINLIETLRSMNDLFDKLGGHPMACGFTLKNFDDLETFKKRLNTKVEERSKDIDTTPYIDIDAQITLEDITWELYDILSKFAPFGQKNPRPKYVSYGVVVQKVEGVGKDNKHLRLMVSHTTPKLKKAMGWSLHNGDAGWGEKLKKGDTIDMVFEIEKNEWNGRAELQLTIVDIKKHES